MSGLKYSELESERTGLNIHRGSDSSIDMPFLEAYINEHDPDVVILRVPIDAMCELASLDRLDRQIIVADALVYYRSGAASPTGPSVAVDGVCITRASTADTDWLHRAVPAIFRDYSNHYSSNPRLRMIDIGQAFSEWAITLVSNEGNECFVAMVDGVPAGFICSELIGDRGEIILNGVLEEFRSRGVYSSLLGHSKAALVAHGASFVDISTQLQNIRVQRVWTREGFVIDRAFLTLHLNRRA
jgi:ribosomal protein S18 acetylase RimI-like enzyme